MGNFLQVPVYQHVIRGIAGYLDLLDEEERAIEPPTKRARLLGNRHRNRGYALNEVDCLSEADFRKMFRMTREGFEELLTLVSPHLHQPNQRMASVSSGSHITQRTKLFVTTPMSPQCCLIKTTLRSSSNWLEEEQPTSAQRSRGAFKI